MTQQVEIAYGVGVKHRYLITITADSMEFFAAAAKRKEVTELQGEYLVEALMSLSRGNILRVERRRDGLLQDSYEGRPAIQEFNALGDMIMAESYENGIMRHRLTPEQSKRWQDIQLSRKIDSAFGDKLKLKW